VVPFSRKSVVSSQAGLDKQAKKDVGGGIDTKRNTLSYDELPSEVQARVQNLKGNKG
jgi:hypothetical protein